MPIVVAETTLGTGTSAAHGLTTLHAATATVLPAQNIVCAGDLGSVAVLSPDSVDRQSDPAHRTAVQLRSWEGLDLAIKVPRDKKSNYPCLLHVCCLVRQKSCGFLQLFNCNVCMKSGSSAATVDKHRNQQQRQQSVEQGQQQNPCCFPVVTRISLPPHFSCRTIQRHSQMLSPG